jgi:ComF family protein
MRAIDELLDLLLPTRCALCDILGSALCSNCVGDLVVEERAVTRGHVRGVVATSYGVQEKKLLHSFKENGQTSLARYLAEPLVPILRSLSDNVNNPLLVPVPSSKENYKKRGFMPTKLLAKRVCKVAGQVCSVADSLSFRRTVADQSHLDSDSRRENLAGSMMAGARLYGRNIILFDDVVTTGSTILEASRAVTEVGGIVVGFFAFAETILKRPSKS